MSHVVSIQTQLHDPAAVVAACRRLQLPAPVPGTAKLFSGAATGWIVQLPGWRYPRRRGHLDRDPPLRQFRRALG